MKVVNDQAKIITFVALLISSLCFSYGSNLNLRYGCPAQKWVEAQMLIDANLFFRHHGMSYFSLGNLLK